MPAKKKARRRGVSEGGADRFAAAPKAGASGTVVSTKGQVILPKAVRERKGWGPGTKLVVEETPTGVTLRLEKPFPATRMEDVFGMHKYKGPPVSVEEMDLAVRRKAAAEHRRITRDRD